MNLWGTKLVTLSACDTGIGEVRNGEGVYGLRRAFVLAGAESMVMSLWPVSDYVTRQMMTAYYTGLRAGLGRGEALRQAKLAMIAARRGAGRLAAPASVLLGQLHPVRRVGPFGRAQAGYGCTATSCSATGRSHAPSNCTRT